MPDEPAAAATAEPVVPAVPAASPQGEIRSQSVDFNAGFDRETLVKNIPEGYDAEKFGKYLDKTADPFVAFKNYSNLEGMKSKGMPNASWEDSDYAALDEARGVPKDADGYKFGEEVQLDEDSSKFVRDFAADAKMTPAQAEKTAALMQQVRTTEAAQAEEKQLQATNNMIEFLSSEWGHPDSTSYQSNFKLVSGVLESIGVKSDSPEADAIWSGSPQIVNLLKSYGDMLDPAVVSSFGAGDTTTPSTIQEQMDELSSQMYARGMDFSSKAYKDMEAKFDRLHAQMERIS